MSIGYKERECESFLEKFRDDDDPTWGFYVYGSYERAHGNIDEIGSHAQETADAARFQAVLNKLHAHAANVLRYDHPAPYNQQLIDTLRLRPAAYLPGASLATVCEHFRQHFAVTDYDDPLNEEKHGPKYSWCLVITDDALQSIDNSPEPIGPTLPEGADAWMLVYAQTKDIFVVLLDSHHTTMEKPEILAASGRGGKGSTIDWYGWCKVAIDDLMRVFTETQSSDDIKIHFRHNDKILQF